MKNATPAVAEALVEFGAVAGSVGTVGLGARSLALTGVQASGAAGNVIAVYWVLVNTAQTPNWELVETD